MTYAIVVAVTAILMASVVVSLNLTAGYAGQPNLAQSAFFGLGAYFAAVLSVQHGLSFWAVLPVSALVSGLAGAVLGAISLRLREDFFAITTVGLNFVVVALFKSIDFFGGATGIYGLPLPTLGGTSFTNDHFLVLSALLLGLVVLVSKVVRDSWYGGMLMAIREDELVASSLGAPVALFKASAFALSSLLAGVVGAVYAFFISSITPETFGFNQSVLLLSMLIIGGMGTIRGAIVGAVLLTLIPEMFRFASDYRSLVYGVFLVLVLRFQPQGLVGEDSWLARGAARLLRRSRSAPAAVTEVSA
ncbi:branched-chain amino acid ABC transporter permease [Nocardioides ginsengisoli]|uniref:Branched-chain amino acid ABC transporter permease n=1 Tax=Nocardioides ginsengisoli TaxID=363868 RepID=A0ABW3VTJ0_9ACTN